MVVWKSERKRSFLGYAALMIVSGWTLLSVAACGSLPMSGLGKPNLRGKSDRRAATAGCGFFGCRNQAAGDQSSLIAGPHPGQNGPLTTEEREMAKIAWKYFENNYQDTTGLVNSVDGYPSTTMWDTASYLAALVSARELEVIDKTTFDVRLVNLLGSFNSMSVFRGELPNKVYNTKTLERVDYTNKAGEIGYSAIDIGRLLIWFDIIKQHYPEHGNAIDRAVLRWKFHHVVDSRGSLYGAGITKEQKIVYYQEGRLGYEEYAAKGFQVWGFTTTRASKPEPYNFVSIYGLDIPYDSRDPRMLGAHNYVVCESYILDAIEFNWDVPGDSSSSDMQHTDTVIADFAQRIYKVQEARYANDGILTARTEHQLDQAPYFVYDTIYSDGERWNTITDTGQVHPEFGSIALKAAIGLWAVWDTDYTRLLYSAVSHLYDPNKGFYEGLLENGNGLIKTFTANNNGIILEALLYKVRGKIRRKGKTASLWESVVADEFSDQGHCYPNDRECRLRQ